MTINPKIKKAIRVAAITFSVIAVVLTLDTAQVALATYDLKEAERNSAVSAAFLADLEGIDKCKDMAGADGRYMPAWRECYLEKVPVAKSVKGAFLHAMNARRWLDENASDDVVRARAVKALDAGWAAFKADEHLYEVQKNFEDEVNRSLVVSLLRGGDKLKSMRDLDERLLEQAEIAIGAPELYKKQALRKADLAMARSALSSTSR